MATMRGGMGVAAMVFVVLLTTAESTLNYNYYDNTCPSFAKTVRDAVANKQIASPTTAAATIRLFFHDCFVSGCDASVLVASTPFNSAERDADINLSLAGDAFDLITRVKTTLELECPQTVSCADILAVATRDLVSMAGGPFFRVPLGRKDSRVSSSSYVEGQLPRPRMPLSQVLQIFQARNFSAQEMVALVGAHTIGLSHCSEFYPYLRTDSGYNPRFAGALSSACGGYHSNPTLSVVNDIMTPSKFDNMYYQNLRRGLGLLSSDHTFSRDPATSGFVEMYAADQNRFFADFASAMVKLGLHGVKTGNAGEIRRRCDQIN